MVLLSAGIGMVQRVQPCARDCGIIAISADSDDSRRRRISAVAMDIRNGNRYPQWQCISAVAMDICSGNGYRQYRQFVVVYQARVAGASYIA